MEYMDEEVEDITHYLKWVKKVNVVENDEAELSFFQECTYFRGQASEVWNLAPGIFRDPPTDEYAITQKAKLRLYNETSFLNSNLDMLIYFQHYGLRTRFLDVTFNPLIALYMACLPSNNRGDCKNDCRNDCKDDNNGAVYCGHEYSRTDSYAAKCTADYIFNAAAAPSHAEDVIAYLSKKVNDAKVERFATPIFIHPPINNPRIEIQDGAFIMAPLLRMTQDGYMINREGLERSDFFDKRRAIIKSENKQSILMELSAIGFDCGSIFRDISSKLKAIMQKEEGRIARIDI